MIHQHFYIELGKALYAVAKADGVLQDREERKLNDLISPEAGNLPSYLKLAPEHQEIILTKLSFYNCVKQNLTVRDAAESYIAFRKRNDEKIDLRLKQLASSLIQAMAASVNGISSTEHAIVIELEQNFK